MKEIHIVTCSKGRYDEAVTFNVVACEDPCRAQQIANELNFEVHNIQAAYKAWLTTSPEKDDASASIAEIQRIMAMGSPRIQASVNWSDLRLHGGWFGTPTFDVDTLEVAT